MPTADLARRNGVELIRTGRWNISTGPWDASRDDLAAAVAAMSCPAVRKPVLKIGHTDDRFTPAGDGEPAIGWVDNLRLTDGGHTLVGDYVGVPAWLDSIMASAYPDRSVEGTYRHRCQLGHTHPFVLTGVALLGVTPPGVGTLTPLNSLDDVKALYGLAAGAAPADEGVRIAASVPGDKLRAAAEQTEHTGAMVALIPTAADAERLAVEGGEPVDELHLTLLYLGKAADFSPKAQAAVVDAVRRATTDTPPVEGHAFAVSAFNPPGSVTADGRDRDTCLVLGVGGDDLEYVQAVAASAARHAALQFRVDLGEPHQPWVPHVTLAYTDDLSQIPALAARTGPIVFDRVRVAFAGERIDIPLTAVDLADIYGPEMADPVAAATADADGNQLKRYWLHGEGLKKWANNPHPWTALYRHLKKYVGSERAKRIASEWFHEHFGYWPGDRRHRKTAASADMPGEDTMPNPSPSLAERIHQAWNAAGQPEQQWIVEAAEDEVIVMDNTDRSLLRVPVTVDGDLVQFGTPQRVRTAYVPADEPVAASRLVFASAEESRPGVVPQPPATVPASETTPPPPAPPEQPAAPAPPEQPPAGDPTQDPAGQPADGDPTTSGDPTGTPPPVPPAAEPEPNTDPKEDPVSTLSTDVRSRLGLPENADDATVLAALADLKAKADAAPNPEQVAAARDEMKAQITELSAELAKIKASAAADAKKALFDDAVRSGRIKPAEREKWEERYDRAPEVTADILASLAPNTAVPVLAAGFTGDTDMTGVDAEYEALVAGIDGPYAEKGGN